MTEQVESLKKTDFVEVVYERDNKLVCIYWKKATMSSDEYRGVFTAVTD